MVYWIFFAWTVFSWHYSLLEKLHNTLLNAIASQKKRKGPCVRIQKHFTFEVTGQFTLIQTKLIN